MVNDTKGFPTSRKMVLSLDCALKYLKNIFFKSTNTCSTPIKSESRVKWMGFCFTLKKKHTKKTSPNSIDSQD